MIQNSGRRFLTPAVVQQCDGAAPSALLRALAALAREIHGYNRSLSSSFPIHRRLVREAIRETGILLEFFEEALSLRPDCLPESAALSLSELHVALQRIRSLVRDCGRRGARLWLLVRSGRVSSEFRVSIRSIATALDVLPLGSTGVPADVREMVELVREQARRLTIAADPDDDRVAGDVLAAVSRFEGGIAPDRPDLERILNHLRIRSWTDCDDEVSFLEEEIAAAADSGCGGSGSDEGEIPFLAGLRGLMLYSRSVMFDFSDGRRSNHSDRSHKLEAEDEAAAAINHLNVEDFRCPISLQLMMDPVTVSTGQTYDRVSIVRWFKAGNLTCPVTGKKLANTELVPNATLRNLIWQFCRDHNVSLPAAAGGQSSRRSHHSGMKIVLPGSPAAAEATRLLANFLVGKLSNGTEEERSRAAYEARLLAKSSIFDRACLVQAGSVPWLLALLSSSSPDASTQENAMAAVLNLSKLPEGRAAIFNSGDLSPILHVLQKGLGIEARQNAAATLFYLSSVEDYRRSIGEMTEAISALVALLKEDNIRGKKNAVAALFGLLLSPGNHRGVLAAGALPNLHALLSSEREDLVTDVLAVLAALAEKPEGASAILRSSSTVPSLVTLLRSPAAARAGKEHCISILLHLCNNGGARAVNLLDRIPSLMPSLYLVLTEGSSRAVKKANSLISVLHRFRDSNADASGPTAPVQQDRVVPVR